jgi:hypothetical protein
MDKDPNPDMKIRGTDPRIRIRSRIKMSRIRNTEQCRYSNIRTKEARNVLL